MLFSKKYTASEIATIIAESFVSQDSLASTLNLCLREGEISGKYRSDLEGEVLSLHIFLCDFSIFMRFGNLEARRIVTDEFWKKTIDTYLSAKSIQDQVEFYGLNVKRFQLDRIPFGVADMFCKGIGQDGNPKLRVSIVTLVVTPILDSMAKLLKDIKLKT